MDIKSKATFATILFTVVIIVSASAFAEEFADAIYHNGNIITIDDAQPMAEAVAVKDGKILAVGAEEIILTSKGETTRLFDLQGRTMLPGFVDAHGHVMGGGLQALSANLLAPPDGEVADIASLQQTLREWIAANEEIVEKVGLIVGFGYDNAQLAEKRHPLREELDAVSKAVPIVLVHQSGHLIAVNSKSLAIGEISTVARNPMASSRKRRPSLC
jgi:hypothetical protein